MSNQSQDIASLLNCHDGFGIKTITVVAGSDVIRRIMAPKGFPRPKALWLHASKRIGEEVGKLLQIKVSDVVARGWATYKELEKYTDPLEYGPDEVVTCVLGEHSMDFTDRPSVQVTIMGDQPQKVTVTFELSVHVQLKGATLTIQAGKVTHAEVGECQLSGVLKLGELQLLERPFGTVALPPFEIRGGLPISQSVAAGN